MNANRWTLAASVLVILTLAANAAFGRSAPPPTGGRTAPPPDGGGGMGPMPGPGPMPVGPVSLAGEYSDMVREANLSTYQQKTVGTIQQDEEKALARYDKDNARRLEDLRKRLAEARNDTARTAFQRQIDLAAATRLRISRSYKLRATGIMTPVQKVAWATYLLSRIMTDEFSALSLSAEQQDKVRILCEMKAKEDPKSDVVTDQKLQDGLKQMIVTQVLDEQQRARYMQILQEREAAKNAATADGTVPPGGGTTAPPPPPPGRRTAPPPT